MPQLSLNKTVCNSFVTLYVPSLQQNTVQTLSMRNVEFSKLLVDGVHDLYLYNNNFMSRLKKKTQTGQQL